MASKQEYINRGRLIAHLKQFAPEDYTPLIEHIIMKEKAADVVERKKTNADKIKEMSDEELASFLNNVQMDAFTNGLIESTIKDYPNHIDRWRDWMKQNADMKGEKNAAN